jgi:hypothetical protein
MRGSGGIAPPFLTSALDRGDSRLAVPDPNFDGVTTEYLDGNYLGVFSASEGKYWLSCPVSQPSPSKSLIIILSYSMLHLLRLKYRR